LPLSQAENAIARHEGSQCWSLIVDLLARFDGWFEVARAASRTIRARGGSLP
jgi:hypothetical protein